MTPPLIRWLHRLSHWFGWNRRVVMAIANDRSGTFAAVWRCQSCGSITYRAGFEIAADSVPDKTRSKL